MTLIIPVKSFLISRGLLKCMAEIHSASEITETYYFKVKNTPIFNADYKIPNFSVTKLCCKWLNCYSVSPSQNLMVFFTHWRMRLILLLWINKEHTHMLQQNMNRYFPETEVIKEWLRIHLLLSSKRSGWLKYLSLQLLSIISVSIWQLDRALGTVVREKSSPNFPVCIWSCYSITSDSQQIPVANLDNL